MKKVLSIILSGIIALSTFALIPNKSVQAASLTPEEVFNQWVNFPGTNLGSGYNAQWSYSETEGIHTTANVGFTGYYNPNVLNFTTGTFEFEVLNQDPTQDPLGFVWGVKKWVNEKGQETYSFYAYEECHCSTNHWTLAYIDKWVPAEDTREHVGPLYHGNIGFYWYDGTPHTGITGNSDYATGTILGTGTGDFFGKRYPIKIEVSENHIKITSDGKVTADVDAPVQAGSYGPVACSNPGAHFYNLEVTADENNAAISSDFDIEVNDKVSDSGKVGDKIEIVDKSKTDAPATIVDKEWVVKLDGEEIYRGDTPYTDYNKKPGKYETTLTVENSQGMTSSTTKELEVKDSGKVIIIYEDEKGNEIKREEITGAVGDEITVQKPEIPGYTFDKIIDGKDNYIITKEDQVVKVVYTKDKDAAIGSNDNNSNNDNNDKKGNDASASVKTSDESNLIFYVAFMTISIIGIGITSRKKFVK